MMKSSLKKTSYILMTLFVLGAIISVINLFQLPGALEKASVKINLDVLADIRPVIYKSLALVGGTLLSGLLFLIINMFSSGSRRSVVTDETETGIGEENDRKEKEQDIRSVSINEAIERVSKKIEQAKGLEKCANKYIVAISEVLEASQGILYLAKREKKGRYVEMLSGYAFTLAESEKLKYEFGEGLVGQVAKEGKTMNISDIPDGYIKIISGLGSASPNHLLIVPLKQNDEVVAVVELASFKAFTGESEELVKRAFVLMEKEMPGKVKNTDNEKKGKKAVKTTAKESDK